ncbi:MAG TPA: L,D-transpeptidase family protein [Solirubrobacteraceae bacterium]
MRSRSFIAVAAILAVLVGVVAAMGVLDVRAKDHIAKGVRVGGVDVGGLTPKHARAKLHGALLAPLGQPIVVHHDRKSWHLTAAQAGISANVGAMVDSAMEVSGHGSIVSRAWRELTGGRVAASLPARVTYSRSAVHKLVTRVEQALNRPAKDASVNFSAAGVDKVASHTGLALKAQRLEDEINHTVARPAALRTFVAHTRKLEPQVTTAQLADRYPAVIIINRSAFRLTLYKNLHPARTYPIAVGRQGLETPAGLYAIQDKQINPSWHVPHSDWAGDLAGKVIPPGPDDPLKARWMGFNGGAGIHGTDADASIGTAASHGCIRMHIPDVIDLYDQVSVGAPVYVA